MMNMKRTCSTTLAILGLLILLVAAPAWAQVTLTGRVLSEQGRELSNANVYINELGISVGTNATGRYTIVVPVARTNGQSVALGARRIGFVPGAHMIVLTPGEQTVDFTLREDINRLQEVVVTGVTGATEQTKLPFSVSTVNAEDLSKVPAGSLLTALAGKVPGANIVSESGRPGASPSVMLRAPTSISTNAVGASPVYIIDGVTLSDQLANTGGGGLPSINVNDIESIEVVKGAAASSLYGARAARGVISITTKRGKNMGEGFIWGTRTEYGTSDIEHKFPIAQTHALRLDESGTRFCITVSGFAQNSCARSINYQSEVDRINNNPGVNALSPSTFPIDPGSTISRTTAGDPLRNMFQNELWPGTNYDAVELFAQPKPFWQQNVDLRGRAGNTSYYASGNAFNQGGSIKFLDGFQRQSARLNVDHTINDWTFALSSYYARDKKDGFDQEDGGQAFFRLTRAPPIANLDKRDQFGRLYIRTNLQGGGSQNENALYRLENQRLTDKTSRFIGGASAQWRPLEWAEMDFNFAYDGANTAADLFRDKGFRDTFGAEKVLNRGFLRKQNEEQQQYNTSANLVLRKTFFGDFNARTTFRYLYEQSKYDYRRSQGGTLAAVGVPNLNNPSLDFSLTSTVQQTKSLGYFGGLGIDWKDRYVFDGLVRRDGSSLFGRAHRWSTFGRAAVAWRLSQEPWWFIPKVNELKLRAAVGTAGNRPPFFAQYETFSLTSGIVGGQATFGNKDLKPETVRETELGVDAELFNRIGLGFTVSKTQAKDQILAVPVAAFFGPSLQYSNAGQLDGQTVELSLNIPIINRRDLTYSVRGSYDRAYATITKLNVPPFTFGSGAQGTDKLFLAKEGERYGTFYGRKYAGSCSDLPSALAAACGPGLDFQRNSDGYIVWIGAGNSPGDGITKNLWQAKLPSNSPFYTTNNAGENGRIHPSVDVNWGMPIVMRDIGGFARLLPMGNSLPKYRYGISQTLRFKNFTAYALLDAAIGRSVYNQGRGWAFLDFLSKDDDQRGKSVEGAKPLGYYYRAGGPDSGAGIGGLYDILGPNSRMVEDASYKKLREASVSYRIGEFGGLNGDWTVSLVGRNLKTWTRYTGFDPEVGFGAVSGQGGSGTNSSGSAVINAVDAFTFPNTRTWTFSLSTSF
ncbi:MAG TPA: SusC/RagA family TonB-linked outer membrane protein [Gemmatimonadaceae bacterium]|nr:SusC/RagA family TonB-linked outer membrane protein [Gemmatimonadaceae bacterium]